MIKSNKHITVAIAVSEKDLKSIDELVKSGVSMSRSAFFRSAIKSQLRKEKILLEKLNE